MSTFFKHWSDDNLDELNAPATIMQKPDTAPEHSRLSPSKAHTWTECTAALAFVKANEHRLPPERPGPSAVEGTKAHKVAECLLLGEPVPDYANKDMLRHGKAYADFCHEVMGPKPHVIRWAPEQRIPLYYLKSERGTVDFHAVTKTGIHLVDYKYGYDPVESVNNLQMAIYARSLIEDLYVDTFWDESPKDDHMVTMSIFQPRIGVEPQTWKITWKELLKFTDERITLKAVSILKGEPGVFKCAPKVCKFCRGTAICEAYNNAMLDDFKDEVDMAVNHEQPKLTSDITDERLVALFVNRDKLTTYLKEVEKFVNGRLASGMKLPGVKQILSKGGHRKWTDEAAAAKLLLDLKLPYDEVYETSVITPAVAEKLTDKMKGPKMIELQRLIIKPPGSPMAVAESDPRPAVADLIDDFKDVDLSETEFWD